MAQRLTKSEALAHWRALPTDAPLRPHVTHAKHQGSTYGHDGVRIEGSREFIDSVLGRLADLIALENGRTRIALDYREVEPRPGKPHSGGEWVCYVKFRERGPMAAQVNAMMGRGR